MIGSMVWDYLRAFRWENIKEQYKYGAGYLSWSIAFMLPIISTGYDMDERTLASFLINFPVALTIFASMIQSIALPKMMYLCPMSRRMRKEYIKKAAYIRMVIPVLLALPGMTWMLASGMFDGLCGIGILFNIVLLSILLGRGSNALNYAKWKAKRDKSSGLDDVMGGRQWTSVVIVIILNCIYVATIGEGDSWWVKGILIGVSLLTLLPITISCMREWPDVVERAASYENCCV